MNNMKLGDRVCFKATIKRGPDLIADQDVIFWHREECAPTEGMLIGIRTLSNGYMKFHSQDSWGDADPPEYVRSESFQGMIIATHLRRKFVYARLEDVELLE